MRERSDQLQSARGRLGEGDLRSQLDVGVACRDVNAVERCSDSQPVCLLQRGRGLRGVERKSGDLHSRGGNDSRSLGGIVHVDLHEDDGLVLAELQGDSIGRAVS